MDEKSILEQYKEQFAKDKMNEDFELPTDSLDKSVNMNEYRDALKSMRRELDDNIQEMINKSNKAQSETVLEETDVMEQSYNRFKDAYEKVTEEDLSNKQLLRSEKFLATIKHAFCPYCGAEIKSAFPVMINPYTMERIARYDCKCGAKLNLDHAYPRLVFYNSDREEIKVYTD
jgi:hypothetical protein